MPDIIRDSKNRWNVSDLAMLYPMDYKIDHAKYYFAITLHAYLVSVIVVFVVVAMESFFIIVIQHSCVLFAITGYVVTKVSLHGQQIIRILQMQTKYTSDESK